MMASDAEQREPGTELRDGAAKMAGAGSDLGERVSASSSDSRPLLLGLVTLVGPLALAAQAGLAAARIFESWVQLPVLVLSLAGIPILVALRYGRRSAWVALQVCWAAGVAVTVVVGAILVVTTGDAQALLSVLVVAVAEVVVIALLVVYMHTDRVKAFCSVRGPSGEVSLGRAVTGVALAAAGSLLLLFWSTAYMEFEVVAESPGSLLDVMAMVTRGHALPGALRAVTVHMPGETALAPAQELADQFRSGVVGHCALAGALIAVGWCVGLWHRYASQELRRAMSLLRNIGLVALVLLLSVGTYLLRPSPLSSDPTAWAVLQRLAEGIDVNIPEPADEPAPQTRQIVVGVGEQGKLTMDGEAVDLKGLESRLRALAQAPEGSLSVSVRPDPDSGYGHLIEVVDVLNETGTPFTVVGLPPPPRAEELAPDLPTTGELRPVEMVATVSISEDGLVYVRNEITHPRELAQRLRKLGRSQGGIPLVVIRAEPGVRFRHIKSVVDHLREAGITNPRFVVVR